MMGWVLMRHNGLCIVCCFGLVSNLVNKTGNSLALFKENYIFFFRNNMMQLKLRDFELNHYNEIINRGERSSNNTNEINRKIPENKPIKEE